MDEWIETTSCRVDGHCSWSGRAMAKGLSELPCDTQSSEFPPEDSAFQPVCGCLGGCDAFLCAAIVSSTPPSKTPKKYRFCKNWRIVPLRASTHLPTHKCVDPVSIWKNLFFRVKRPTIVPKKMDWKQGVEWPLKHPKSLGTRKFSGTEFRNSGGALLPT